MDIQTDYRFIVCANYLIIYRYEDSTIFVSRILYAKRYYIRILFGNLPEDEKGIQDLATIENIIRAY